MAFCSNFDRQLWLADKIKESTLYGRYHYVVHYGPQLRLESLLASYRTTLARMDHGFHPENKARYLAGPR